MPRAISFGYRTSTRSLFSPDADLLFLIIAHESLDPSIRVVNDTVDYRIGDELYTGFPFEISLLSDTDEPPRAQLSIQNVDRRIGDTIQSISTPARMFLSLASSSDFDLTVRPRVALGEPSIEYEANYLFLANVHVDAMMVTGDIMGWDFGQRVWPYRRATKAALPGLYR